MLFDVGLGAASNALAAWQVSEAAPAGARRLEIVSFDDQVVALELALLPQNAGWFGLGSAQAHAASTALLRDGRCETARTSWRLALGDFPSRLALEPAATADIVFWDLYSARANPRLWTVELFSALRLACADAVTLHTTNTSTSSRTAMLLAGFAVGASVGTGDRAETTIASANHRTLEHPLDARWSLRLARSSDALPSQFSADAVIREAALARIRGLPQFL